MDIAVRKVFSSNAYTFAGKTRIQSDGSPIGLDLSGEIGRLEMGDWDVELAEICERNCVKGDLSDRYVNDINIVMNTISHGYRWTGEMLEYDQQWELEDERTPAIQMEGDYGSKQKDTVKGTPEMMYYQVSFKFFKKPMARPTIMNAITTMTEKMKRETTSNELMRRLLNTSQGLPNSEADMEEAVNEYMVQMRNSGYNAQYRYKTLVNTVSN